MRKRLLLISGFLILTQIASAQPSKFSAQQYVDEEGDTLNYRISYPDFSGAQSYPVVIFLHGAGERGNDNISQLKWGVYESVANRAQKYSRTSPFTSN